MGVEGRVCRSLIELSVLRDNAVCVFRVLSCNNLRLSIKTVGMKFALA